MVGLGVANMIDKVSTLASHMALPRETHLFAVYQVFAHFN